MARRKKTGNGAYRFHGEQYWQTADYNTRLFNYYRNKITALAVNRFKWLNLPRTCDQRYLEMALFYNGMATIAYPRKQVGVFYSTKATLQGIPNIYGYPVKWLSIGNNGWRFNVTRKNGVFIYDNSQRFPMVETANIWARELVDIQRTKQVNRFHQKIPMIMTGNQDKQLDMTNIAKQVGGGEPMIIGYEQFNDIEYKPLMTQPAPFIGEQLTEAEKAVWEEIYSALGIPNLTFKTERMIEDEVKSHESAATTMLLDGLQERRKAADALNERFYYSPVRLLDKPIEVVFNTDWQSNMYNDIRSVPMLAEISEGGASNDREFSGTPLGA